jgi:hypothetical protein
MAPATATGPVRMCPGPGGMAAWMAARPGGTARPLSAGGITSGLPETHSSTTVSPDAMVSTGGMSAPNSPQLIVSGVAEMR